MAWQYIRPIRKTRMGTGVQPVRAHKCRTLFGHFVYNRLL